MEESASNLDLRENESNAVVNSLYTDKLFFDCFIRNINELKVINRLNLISVCNGISKVEFEDPSIQIIEKITKISYKIISQKDKPIQDFSVEVSDNESVKSIERNSELGRQLALEMQNRLKVKEVYIYQIDPQDFTQRYEIKLDKQIGICAYGIVYQGFDKHQQKEVAIKSITIHSDQQEEMVQNQLEYHIQLSNKKKIVRLFNYCKNQILDIVNMVPLTTYLVAVDLGKPFLQKEIQERLKNNIYNLKYRSLSETMVIIDKCVNDMEQMAKCVKFLHQQQLVHLNLQHNKFIRVQSQDEGDRLVLTDLGQLRVQKITEADTLVPITEKFKVQEPGFKVQYASPELQTLMDIPKFRRIDKLKQNGGLFNFLFKTDIYQLGLIFSAILGTKIQKNNKEFLKFWQKVDFPFDNTTQEDINKYRLSFIKNFDADDVRLINVKHLIINMISQNPKERPELDAIINTLQAKELI